MRKIFTFYIALAIGLVVLNGFVTEASNQDSFWNEAAQSGMAEVMLGNLALQKSSNEEVKQMAQKIVDDHTAANNELKDLAATKSATLPTEVNSKQKGTYATLIALSGEEFDKEFIKVMVKDHEKAVGLFQKQVNKGADADVKAFAAKTLPTLQGHLESAKAMKDKMKSMKSSKKNSDGDKNMNSNTNTNSNRK